MATKAVLIGVMISAAFIIFAGATYASGLFNGAIRPNISEPTPYIIVDRDLDGIPDDLEEELGYSTSERDVRFYYWVQNPSVNKPVVDAAIAITIDKYKHENPLKINIHSYYAGEIPEGVRLGNDEYRDFMAFTHKKYDSFANFVIQEYSSPTGAVYKDLDDVFIERGIFLDEEASAIKGNGGGGIGSTLFYVLAKHPNGSYRSDSSVSNTIMHEMGHNMGLDHSSNPQSIMTDESSTGDEEFIEEEWAIISGERLLDFRPNPVVAKYVP